MTVAEKATIDVARIRAEFPILARTVRGRPLVYLDNAATSQRPLAVVDRERDVSLTLNANIHRGVHWLSERATIEFEDAREKVRRFLGADAPEEVVFTRGTTEAINLVASSWGNARVAAGDEILVTRLEHHSNIVPWQLLAGRTGAKVVEAPINDAGELLLDELAKRLSPRTRLVAVGHVSNALGTINPVREIAEMAHRVGALVLVDGAQAVPHLAVDVRALGADFYAFSGHKMYGPTGVGALWGRRELLEEMPPWQGGGDMISTVSFEEGSRWNVLPYKFEAGTPNIAGVIALGAAVDWLLGVGLDAVAAWEHELLEYATARLSTVPGLRIVGTAREKAAVVSFVLEGIHPHDIGTILDQDGVAIRTGHHCAQPVMDRFGVPATARASFAVYNTKSEVDALVAALLKVHEVFA